MRLSALRLHESPEVDKARVRQGGGGLLISVVSFSDFIPLPPSGGTVPEETVSDLAFFGPFAEYALANN